MKAAQQAESALSKSDASSSRYITLSQCIGDSHYRLASFYQKAAFGSDVSSSYLNTVEPSAPDTLGPIKIVLISKMLLFQGLI